MASVRGRVGLLLAAANAAAAISGDFGSTETAGITPAEVAAFLKPELTFVPDKFRADSAAAAAEAVGAWQAVARTLTGLQKLDCGHDAGVDGRVTFKERELLNATEAMLDAAAAGDALAMSGLGHLYLLGDACSPKRNLTWATHWLDGAAAQWQPDALAMLGFLAESRALPRLYNYTLHDPASVLVPGAGSVSGSASNSVSASNSPAAKSGRALYEAAVSSGGSVLASMALGWKHANGVDVPVSCPAAAAHYEAAAIAAVAALDRRRQQVQDY